MEIKSLTSVTLNTNCQENLWCNAQRQDSSKPLLLCYHVIYMGHMASTLIRPLVLFVKWTKESEEISVGKGDFVAKCINEWHKNTTSLELFISGSAGMNIAAVLGGIIGGLVILLAFVFAAFCCCRHNILTLFSEKSSTRLTKLNNKSKLSSAGLLWTLFLCTIMTSVFMSGEFFRRKSRRQNAHRNPEILMEEANNAISTVAYQ